MCQSEYIERDFIATKRKYFLFCSAALKLTKYTTCPFYTSVHLNHTFRRRTAHYSPQRSIIGWLTSTCQQVSKHIVLPLPRIDRTTNTVWSNHYSSATKRRPSHSFKGQTINIKPNMSAWNEMIYNILWWWLIPTHRQRTIHLSIAWTSMCSICRQLLMLDC